MSDVSKQPARKQIELYTDGACEPNPGKGGYGVVLIYGAVRKESSGGYRLTTNNRMEILAVIKGLELLKESCSVNVYSDSTYVVDAMMKGWVVRWKAKNWWRTNKERAINIDLWERLLVLVENHSVTFTWIKGHAGDPNNERCDRLSYAALRCTDLAADDAFENKESEPEPIKITQDGQPCRKCGTPVIKRVSKKHNQYLFCPTCQASYEWSRDQQKTQEVWTLF